MIKLVAFDLDNVLIAGEAIDELGKLMNVQNEISQITKRAMQGDLNFETALKKRVALLKGASLNDIKNVVKGIPLMTGAKETIVELKERGYKLATITGSFDIVANRLKDELGLDYACANILGEKDGILTGEVSGRLVEGSKADVLCEIIKMEKISSKECAAVGDGANDVSMLKEAGLGIAFNAKPVLKDIAEVVIDKRDLKELLQLFKSIEEESRDSEDFSSSKIENLELDYHKLLLEKNNHEKELIKLKRERDELNQQAKNHRQLRDSYNVKIKDKLNKALQCKEERDKTNEKVREYKKLRQETKEKLKSIEWASGKMDRLKVKKEIKKLDKAIETEVMEIRKENELVKRVTDLSKQLQEMQEDEKMEKEARKLKKLSESYHDKVVRLSDEAQIMHEKMLESFQKVDDMRKKTDTEHSEFVNCKERASEKHEDVKAVLGNIRSINQNLDKLKVKRRNLESEVALKKDIEEKNRAEDIYQKFKRGKKLTTDELLLLQKHKIV